MCEFINRKRGNKHQDNVSVHACFHEPNREKREHSQTEQENPHRFSKNSTIIR